MSVSSFTRMLRAAGLRLILRKKTMIKIVPREVYLQKTVKWLGKLRMFGILGSGSWRGLRIPRVPMALLGYSQAKGLRTKPRV